jgi:hypothetical protein
MGTRKVSLHVNDAPIEIDYFVQGFIDHVTSGIIAALSGTGSIGDLDLCVEEGAAVTIKLNSVDVPLNAFAGVIIKSTVLGMVSSLKEVGEVRAVRISLSRQ